MPKSASSSTEYLERKSGKWRVSVAVPRHLQAALGTRLKQSLGTDSLAIANRLKWPVVAELKAKIAEHDGGSRADALVKEAVEVARLRRRVAPEDLEAVDYAIVERAESIAGEPIGTSGGEPVYDPVREKAALRYAEVARGTAIPIDLHHSDYIKQVAEGLTRRTVADDERAIRFLRQWCDDKRIPFMLHQVTRRTASQFMDELATVSGAPSPVTHQKYLTRLSRYWRWLLERDIAQANPWAGLRPATKPARHDEMERPFADAEVRKLLDGPATPAMHDLMRIAALSESVR